MFELVSVRARAALVILLLAGCGRDRVATVCPDGTFPIDGQCPSVNTCGDGVLQSGEKCDTAISSGAGACPTALTCAPSSACETVVLDGVTCQETCARTAITQAISGDGCCPPGATHAQDSDCPVIELCGNGVLDPGELCDPAIPSNQAGSCPTTCFPGDVCTDVAVTGSGCQVHCASTPKSPGPSDGCCPGPMYAGTDPDCPALPRCGGASHAFDAQLKWEWGSAPALLKTNGSTAVSPIVARFTDTNGNGKIDPGDTPGILIVVNGLMSASVPANGAPPAVIALLDGATGATRWVKDGSALGPISPYMTPAVGDLDGDGVPDIVTGIVDTADSNLGISRLIALDAQGNVKWLSDPLAYETTADALGAPAIADLDGDGSPEVIFGNHVFDSSGKLKWHGPKVDPPAQIGRFSIVAQLGGAPGMQILDGNTLYAADGTQLWSQPAVGYAFGAIASCDGDGKPQILLAGQPDDQGAPSLVLLNADGTIRKGPLSIPALRPNTPIAAGDVDGDGKPEFVIGATTSLVILDCNLEVKASAPISDLSGASGPVLFDFDGDGALEIVYGDEQKIRVIDGHGAQLWSDDRPSVTGLETPTVADVDGDGHAEILVPQSRSSITVTGIPTPQGVRVYEAKTNPWRGAPAIWNEHTFHALNVFEDGRIPAQEGPWWSTFNAFRAAISLQVGGCP